MCIRNRLASLIYKLFVVLLSGYGLYLYSGLPAGALNLNPLKYYTIQSNLLVCIFFLIAAIYTAARLAKKGVKGVSVFAPHFKGAVTMAILVTMLIYQFILAPNNFVMPGSTDAFRNNIVHLFVPLAVLVDYILFDRKGRYTAGDPFYWLVIPLLYYVYAVIAAMLGVTFQNNSRYAYDFINSDIHGWGRVLVNVALLCLAFLLLGYIIYGIDKLLGAFAKKPVEAGENGRKVFKAGDKTDSGPDPKQDKENAPEEIVAEPADTADTPSADKSAEKDTSELAAEPEES